MSCEVSIHVANLVKSYEIYKHPTDRLQQLVLPKIQNFLGITEGNYCTSIVALKNVSFDVMKGETIGILGRNGSGKSTLLQIICGILKPTQGKCFTKGRIAALLELGSGFNPEFTGLENIYMKATILGLSTREIDLKLNNILEFADIGEFIKHPLKTYSSGMAIRLAFSVAISVDPDILIVDEALAVGDELFQRKCIARIEEIRRNGASVLLVSHSVNQIMALCNRAILLDAGEVLSVGKPNEVIKSYHKLIFGKESDLHRIRLSIKKSHSAMQQSNDTNVTSLQKPSELSYVPTRDHQLNETYDANLVPKSTVDYETNGACISTPKILTLDGRRVNGLIRGRRYIYQYEVRFENEAENVRFGMSIKSKSGVFLAGSFSSHDLLNSIHKVDANNTVNVSFAFNCNFNPGIYFTNAGAYSNPGGQNEVLHRRMEITAFSVLPMEKNCETEDIYLNFEPKFIIKENK